jgi:hypothetical protein
MIQGILVEGLIRAVVEVGLDQFVGQKPDVTIDLTPVIEALDELNRQNRDIFGALSRPTQTAGEEMYERAVTAFTERWYDDALTDALKSIDLYPYSGKPWLVGGLAALALGKGDKGFELLRSAVKYSAHGQPEVGAVAAIVASQLALTVGGTKVARNLLEDANEHTGGRCPAVVGALWHQGAAAGDPLEKTLTRLWWDDHKPTTDYSRSLLEGLFRSATAAEPDYLTAGKPFLRYLDELADLASSNVAAFDAVSTRLNSFVNERAAKIDDAPVRKALRYTQCKPTLGFMDMTVAGVLAKCRSLPGAAKWPGDDVWKDPRAHPQPASVRDLFLYVQRASGQLLEALNELPAIAADPKRPAAERTAVNAALPFRNRWITALGAVRTAANVDVADRAAGAWERYLAARGDLGPQQVMHLKGLGDRLFAVVGGLDPARDLAGTRQLPSIPAVSIVCPGCKFRQDVPEGIKKINCSHCGKAIVFNRCPKTNKVFPVLLQWKAWTCPSCKRSHPIVKPR